MLVRLIVLRSFYNPNREGRVRRGDELRVDERRARELLRRGLVKRFPAPDVVKPVGPTVTKPAAPTVQKAVAARHTGGAWYEILDAGGNVIRKVRGKKKRDEALAD